MSGPRGLGAFLAASTSARALFICGALLFPAFLLQQDIVVRAAQICLFLGVNALSGRRIRLGQLVAVTAGIALFNLVTPTGRVLVTVLGLPVTEGALKTGLLKATAMSGLLVLSQFSIRSALRFPGWFGGLIGRSLYYFEAIMSQRRRIDRRDLVGSIDMLLIEVQGSAEEPPAADAARQSLAGLVFLAGLCVVNWGAFIYTLFHPHPFWGG